MKHRYGSSLYRLPLWSLCLLVACTASPGSAEKSLRYHWTPGQAWTQHIVSDQHITTVLNEVPAEVNQHLELWLQVQVDSLLPGEQRVLRAHYTRLRIVQYAGDDAKTIDSRDSVSWNSQLGRLYHPLLAATFRIQCDARGGRLQVRQVTGARDHAQEADARLGAQALEELLQQVWVPLPAHSNDNSWKATFLTRQNIPMQVQQEWRHTPDSLQMTGALSLHPHQRAVLMGVSRMQVHKLAGTTRGTAWPDSLGHRPPKVYLRQQFRAQVAVEMAGKPLPLMLIVDKTLRAESGRIDH
ncbi:MAG: hypothetical protein KF690_00435 [Bacteroidetes bacterium]|nr:hypothetical protein [Bacteroidota bacterium]